ncbi:glycosyltransferase [Shewanella xiamenensis]|uniref:glycosyltransferase n=1 Tax=Shewanella xiamenensis TaxID=332186 RepID=UPI0011859A13|nr:glycosyltransferase [Shewanella xiamenensis]TVL33363.1 glycosyl transferase [Shewanella xiamenensis]
MTYDYLIVTHLPAFYKINLYNEMAKKLNIFVIFIAVDTEEKRSADFTDFGNVNFKYEILADKTFQARNLLVTSFKLATKLRKCKFKKLLVCGWDLPEFWLAVLLSSSPKNCLALESTVLESNTNGLRGLIKKIFLSFIDTVFASGDLHVELLKTLDYDKKIIVTRGVGIINKPSFSFVNKHYRKRFLFVGRLTSVKNLKVIIDIFNSLPEFKLSIVGSGDESKMLKENAKCNIFFIPPVDNKLLRDIYLDNDIFILPSKKEPWGLVVEEALFFGLPVIVSKNCGSRELIEHGVNGYIIDPDDYGNLRETILSIDDAAFAVLQNGVNHFSVNDKDVQQISSYLY